MGLYFDRARCRLRQVFASELFNMIERIETPYQYLNAIAVGDKDG